MINYHTRLCIFADILPTINMRHVAYDLLNNSQFIKCSGSVGNKHHYGDGGLVRHTYELLEIGNDVMNTLNLKSQIDYAEFFFAGLYHDAGKMHDYYRMSFPSDPRDNDSHEWIATPHKRDIHHISRSGIIWSRAVEKYPELDKKYHDKVLHAILSHHGCREFGSPVAPHSRVAWLVHMCDQMSARMDDCEKIDLVHEKK